MKRFPALVKIGEKFENLDNLIKHINTSNKGDISSFQAILSHNKRFAADLENKFFFQIFGDNLSCPYLMYI